MLNELCLRTVFRRVLPLRKYFLGFSVSGILFFRSLRYTQLRGFLSVGMPIPPLVAETVPSWFPPKLNLSSKCGAESTHNDNPTKTLKRYGLKKILAESNFLSDLQLALFHTCERTDIFLSFQNQRTIGVLSTPEEHVIPGSVILGIFYIILIFDILPIKKESRRFKTWLLIQKRGQNG